MPREDLEETPPSTHFAASLDSPFSYFKSCFSKVHFQKDVNCYGKRSTSIVLCTVKKVLVCKSFAFQRKLWVYSHFANCHHTVNTAIKSIMSIWLKWLCVFYFTGTSGTSKYPEDDDRSNSFTLRKKSVLLNKQ